jgi:hypothetical protein
MQLVGYILGFLLALIIHLVKTVFRIATPGIFHDTKGKQDIESNELNKSNDQMIGKVVQTLPGF